MTTAKLPIELCAHTVLGEQDMCIPCLLNLVETFSQGSNHG